MNKEKCVVCLDTITGGRVHAPCGHDFDLPCIRNLFKAAVRDESSFPPRCCYLSIPLVSVQPHLPSDLVNLYVERDKESGTLNRVYCSRQKCSRFLGARLKDTTLHCPAPDCLTHTCGWCKVDVTPGNATTHKCTDNGDVDQQIFNISQHEGWVRCPGCGRLIELNQGCYHITCRCKTEFCYLCSASWKTCSCRRCDREDPGLICAAEARVRHLHGANGVRNRVLLRRAMVHLRSPHNCGHVQWKPCWGRLRACQMCYRRRLWNISRCMGCQTLACDLCLRNQM